MVILGKNRCGSLAADIPVIPFTNLMIVYVKICGNISDSTKNIMKLLISPNVYVVF